MGPSCWGGEVSPYHRQSPWKKCWGLMKDGDLWQLFAEHVRAKNPESVKLTKVKGHATNDMVREQLVRFDDMHGNNESDAAAEQGATLVRPAVKHFAKFYQKRHQNYSKLMAKIPNFIVKVKKADKERRKQKAKEENPLNNKEKEKIKLPRTLLYEHEMHETMQIKLRRPRRQDYANEDEWKEAARACNYLTHTRWNKGKEETEAGIPGTTWLELYIHYKLHDAKKVDKHFLAKKKNLQSEIACLKKCFRKIATECIDEGQEWILQTCYSRRNRLMQAGITNKHAGAKGMPVLTQIERDMVMEVIAELRGKGSKKNLETFRKGNLSVTKGSLRYGRKAEAIEARSGLLQTWTNAPAADSVISFQPEKLLTVVMCPGCQAAKCTKNLALKRKSQFSNLKCDNCSDTFSARNWSCRCGNLWKKCPQHVMAEVVPEPTHRKRLRQCDPRGSTACVPKFRKGNFGAAVACSSNGPVRSCIELPPTGKLAAKFPHLVKRVVPDQRGTHG